MATEKERLTAVKARIALIDEFGELDRRVAEFKPVVDRHKKLKEEIEGWYAQDGAADSFVAEGHRYQLQISAKRKEREIVAMPKLFRALGKERFLEFCKFPLTVLDRLLPNSAPYVQEEHSGRRTIRAVAKAMLERAA